MPIAYTISIDGHFIHAKTTGKVSSQEFINYEISHATDKRLKAPISELFEVENDSLKFVNENDISVIMSQREQIKNIPAPHRCAIVVSLGDIHAWNLARFYEEMVTLHYPESVVVFGDNMIARTWLGIGNHSH